MKIISREEIKRKLATHYGGNIGDSMRHRTLVEYNHDEGELLDNGRVVFFFLSGSPPKGYAIVVPGHRTIHLYDAWGRRFRIIDEIELEEKGAEVRR